MSGRRNLATRLRCRRSAQPMARYDRLPPDLRRWLAQAALPWSAAPALRLWRRALRETGGDALAARARMDAAEARTLARDSLAQGPNPVRCLPPG
ncbi:hypothetical protein SAMN05421641_12714 [Paracoccus thiocyanatus]|uniref:Uncharacterized protein n=1 Tax=Paracoccus thiocyanatus TaxID=34006 RepID=A0A1N6YIM2_9RHOB|nr:DUF6525 family protein [Paracoccus thiocyanatus]SIR14356.1 hypothetical protein SAMN05421641_12714 [Paracoccus thiocyanatus]